MKDSRIYTLMIMASVFWGASFIAGKLSAPYIPAFTLTFMRFFVATAVLYLVILRTEEKIYKLKKEDIPVFIVTGVVCVLGYHVLFFTALKYTTAINSSIIDASTPLITTFFSIIFLKDKITLTRILGIILSFTGVFLTITGASLKVLKTLSFNYGDIIMLLGVAIWSWYSVLSKKLMQRYTPITLTFYSFLFCTIFLVPFVIYDNPAKFMSHIPYYSYLAVIYMAVFPSVIGYLVQQIAVKHIGPSKTSLFINLVPVFSIILSIVILGESISPTKLFTAALIIAGVYIAQKD